MFSILLWRDFQRKYEMIIWAKKSWNLKSRTPFILTIFFIDDWKWQIHEKFVKLVYIHFCNVKGFFIIFNVVGFLRFLGFGGFGYECISWCLFHCPTSAISSGVERSQKARARVSHSSSPTKVGSRALKSWRASSLSPFVSSLLLIPKPFSTRPLGELTTNQIHTYLGIQL